MDNTILNVRVMAWHFQIERGTWRPSLSRNDYHPANGWPNGYVSVYNFFGFRP